MPAESDPPVPASTRASGRDRAAPGTSLPPALPIRSTDDTDVGWSEGPERDDEERLRADRPPHWAL